MIKILRKLRIEWIFLNLFKAICENPITSYLPMKEWMFPCLRQDNEVHSYIQLCWRF